MLRALVASLSLLLLVGVFPASADVIDDGGGPADGSRRPAPAPPPAPAPAPAAVIDDWNRHHLSVYLSSASTSDFDASEFNGGGEYEFQFSKYVGIGAQVEGTTGNFRNMVALVPIFIHPWKGLRLTVGGGAILDEDNNSDGLLRVGIGYRFNLTDNITFAPEYNADLPGANGDNVNHLFGIRLGYSF